MTSVMSIRHTFRPGDIGHIVIMHGTTYARDRPELTGHSSDPTTL